jgi:hypothetical protein
VIWSTASETPGSGCNNDRYLKLKKAACPQIQDQIKDPLAGDFGKGKTRQGLVFCSSGTEDVVKTFSWARQGEPAQYWR